MKIGAYEVGRRIGEGGAAIVFHGRAPDGREVAVKLLRRGDSLVVAKFEREKRLLAALGEREGFVPFLDAGLHGQQPFVVMPFLAGGTLRDRLDERKKLDVRETVWLGRKIASALGRAHDRGIVHRDVKPENVLFNRDGEPLISDLGLAKHFRDDDGGRSISLSRTGELRGTPGYMAPEQIEDSKNVGPQADVFALGAMLYECLTGHPPFEGATLLEVLDKAASGVFRELPRETPRWLAAIIERALATDAKDRFAAADSMAEALEAPHAASSSQLGSALRAVKPRRALAIGGGVAAGLVAAALLLVALTHERGGVPGRDPGTGPVASSVAPGAPRVGERDAWLAKAREASERFDDAAAIEACTRAIEADPRSADAFALRGGARSHKGETDAAIADCTKAIELDPVYANGWGNRGSARLDRGDYSGAVLDLTRAIDLDRADVRYWVNRATARYTAGDLKGALADAEHAVAIAPDDASAWRTRGVTRYSLDDAPGALSDLTRAIELDPRDPSARFNRGEVRLGTGDLAGAIVDFTRVVETTPADGRAWMLRGVARRESGDAEGAFADLSRATELVPRNGRAWCERGLTEAARANREEGIRCFTKSIELEPEVATGWGGRGALRAAKGDRVPAIADLTRAMQLAPSNPVFVRNRGIAKQELGDASGAIEDLERAIQLYTSSDPHEVAEIRARIDAIRNP